MANDEGRMTMGEDQGLRMNRMLRRLWLVYERVGHPDAVSYLASEEDARLVAELFQHPYAKRVHIAEQLRNFLEEQRRLSPAERQRVPCRRASGLYQLVPWRLAKWLSIVLRAEDTVAQRTRERIEGWLDSGREGCVLDPRAEGVAEQRPMSKSL